MIIESKGNFKIFQLMLSKKVSTTNNNSPKNGKTHVPHTHVHTHNQIAHTLKVITMATTTKMNNVYTFNFVITTADNPRNAGISVLLSILHMHT